MICRSRAPDRIRYREHAVSSNPINWPPKVIFNTDGNWVNRYLPSRAPEAVTVHMDYFADTSVDALSVMIGVDDDLSWRGSPHAGLWGDNVESWDPDDDPTRIAEGGKPISEIDRLHKCLTAVITEPPAAARMRGQKTSELAGRGPGGKAV